MSRVRELLLGIDIGTSACKLAVFNTDGKIVASSREEYLTYYPQPGYVEQNPNEWWIAVKKAIRNILDYSDVCAEEIRGIGVDGQSWSAIAIDKEGSVLTNSPIWIDTRSSEICKKLREKHGDQKFFSISGNSLQPFYTTGKILWYKQEMPDVYKHAWKILQSNSFIVYRLTGMVTHDLSQGYGLHCFDMHRGVWNESICELLGIRRDLLPELFPCHQVVGYIMDNVAKETGLKTGTPVVAGGLDASCGTLGAGVLKDGETQEQGGQAGGMSICTETYISDPALILGYHVVPGRWLLQGGTTGGGGAMRWFEKEFASFERSIADKCNKSSLVQLNELAERVPEGSDGLIFLPYMAGERSPIWNSDAKGVFYGIDFNKTKGHFVRAVMEGVAFSLEHNISIAKSAGANILELRSIGGAANSVLWTQIKADVTGQRIVVPSSDTATTLGAVILAGVGVGLYDSFEDAVSRTVHNTRVHEPDMEKHRVYQKYYQIFLELYRNLEPTMSKRQP